MVELIRGSLFLFISTVFIAIVTLNNSALLVTGSNLGVTLVQTPMAAQIVALVIMIVTIFILVYQIIQIKWYYSLLIFVFSFALFTLSMHTFVWNYTHQKVQDIWLLMSMQEIPTINKSPDVMCQLSRHRLRLTHPSGASMTVLKGIYPWVLNDKLMVTGCQNKVAMDKYIKAERMRRNTRHAASHPAKAPETPTNTPAPTNTSSAKP